MYMYIYICDVLIQRSAYWQMAVSPPSTAVHDNTVSSRDSQHTSLVSSQDRRGYGTVKQGSRLSNGFLIHEVADTDTLQGLALQYNVAVSCGVLTGGGLVSTTLPLDQ